MRKKFGSLSFMMVALCIMLLVFVLVIVDITAKSYGSKLKLKYPAAFNTGWRDVNDDSLLSFPLYITLKSRESMTITTTLPEVPEGTTFAFYSDGFAVNALIDGEVVYDYSVSNDDKSFTAVPDTWNMVTPPFPTKGRVIRLTFTAGEYDLHTAIDSIYTGSYAQCLIYIAATSGALALSGILMVLVGFAIMIIWFFTGKGFKYTFAYQMLNVFAVLLGINMLAFSGIGQFFFKGVHISWALCRITLFLIPVTLITAMWRYLEIRKKRVTASITKYLCILSVVLLLICASSQIVGYANFDNMQNIAWLMYGLALICTVCVLTTVDYTRILKHNAVEDSYPVCFFVAALMMVADCPLYLYHEAAFPGSFTRVAGVLVLCYSLASAFRVRTKLILERETLSKQLENQRLTMMISQIKPHFIYNTLAAIRTQIMTSPDAAQKTLLDFSKYLRANVDSITDTRLVPFENELDNIRVYANVEMMRFPGRVNVIYDIQDISFTLPPLTLQPIVENAIRHGLCPKENGGTVCIRSRSTEKHHVIFVEDNGVGFDISNPHNDSADDGEHISAGLKNVMFRLKVMADAVIDVSSTPGKGTIVTVKIPKKNSNNDKGE